MKRLTYVSQLKKEYEDISSGILTGEANHLQHSIVDKGISCFQVFRFGRLIFVYLEAANEFSEFVWPEAQQLLLEIWPGLEAPRYCMPLMDIFHDGDPVRDPNWRTNYTPEQQVGSLARLKPDMNASYIYYHYQLQEEKPGSFNKTYMISSFGDYIFSYFEQPTPPKWGEALQGKLQSKQTPDNWHELMYPHFIPWDDLEPDHNLWRIMENVYSYWS